MTDSLPPLSLGVLISGSGTTLQNLVDRIADGRLAGVRIAVVISSRTDVPGVRRARAAGLPVEFAVRRSFAEVGAFSQHVAALLERYGCDWAIQAGWLCYWRLPPRWMGRVLNIHPALLPDFGGKGFYGDHVHQAVLAAGRRASGATVHLVDNEYDHGPVVLQRSCPVMPDDNVETLRARVAEIEHEILPQAIDMARRGMLSGKP